MSQDAEPMLAIDPASYFPVPRGRYEVAPGLSKFGKSFGQGEADRHVFQFDRLFPRYRAGKLAARRESLAKYYQTADLAPSVADRIARFIATRLAAEHPSRFTFADVTFHARLTGDRFSVDRQLRLRNSTPATPPYADAFDALASQVQEDLAIVSTDADRHWASAIHLCFPNHWAAADKIGKPFAAIHEPVAGMAEMNRRARELIDIMIQATDGLVRFAWGITWDDELNHHPDIPPGQRRTARFDTDHPRAFLRVERQTIWGFPDVGASLFTIRTYLYNCAELRNDPETRQKLIAGIESMSDASLRYKGLYESREAFLRWMKTPRT